MTDHAADSMSWLSLFLFSGSRSRTSICSLHTLNGVASDLSSRSTSSTQDLSGACGTWFKTTPRTGSSQTHPRQGSQVLTTQLLHKTQKQIKFKFVNDQRNQTLFANHLNACETGSSVFLFLINRVDSNSNFQTLILFSSAQFYRESCWSLNLLQIRWVNLWSVQSEHSYLANVSQALPCC